ncbi:MAG: monovalent cation/H(+) antiporter subunit G [Anaerolineae bacterium]|nr:monovalent cation/H(+) antiporter subunit G [Anaerolineae bacterium]
MREVISGILILIGAVFSLLAGVGILRMPDLYTRMSATTKVATLGVGSTLLAVTVYFGELDVATRALATIAFVFLTAPVAAHMIGRAAYFTGVPLWKGTVVDELRGHYDLRTHELESVSFPELELRLPDIQVYRIRIPEGSAIAGKTLAEIELRKRYNVTLLAVCRGSHVLSNPDGDLQLFAQDELIILGPSDRLDEILNVIRSLGSIR